MMKHINDEINNKMVVKITCKLPQSYYVEYKPNPEFKMCLRGELTQGHPLGELTLELSSKLHREIVRLKYNTW